MATKRHARVPCSETIAQMQYLVKWEVSHIEKWALKYHETAGYTACCPVRPCMRTDMTEDEGTCEVCWKGASMEFAAEEENHSDMLICDSCEKTYHIACLGQPRGWRPDMALPWHCPACIAQNGPPAVDEIIEVDWTPSWEPEETLSHTDAGRKLIHEWQTTHRNLPPGRMPGDAPDSDMSNLERQGFHDACQWQTTMGNPLRRRVHIELHPVNPQVDIQPGGCCKIQIRDVDLWAGLDSDACTDATPHATSPGRPLIQQRELACFYRPDGRCVGAITVQRLGMLRKMFLHAGSSGAHTGLSSEPLLFEEEMVDLMLRYRSKDNAARQWRAPSSLTSVLNEYFNAFPSTTKERFATPIDVASDTRQYWTSHQRDAAFGACHDAFQCKWTGYSTAFPRYEEIERCVRHALHSASMDSAPPTATVLLLPAKLRPRGREGYNKWLDAFPNYCTRVAQIKGGPVPLSTDLLMGMDQPLHMPQHHLDIVIVWNAAARAQLALDRSHTASLIAALHAASQQLSGKLTAHAPRRVDDSHHLGNCWGSQDLPTPAIESLEGPCLKASRKFRLAHPEPTRQAQPIRMNPAESDTEQYRENASPLRFNWDEIAYTDGSCLRQKDNGTKLGAAVYIPSRADHNHVLIDPAGMGDTDTINRAELSGIWGSLTNAQNVTATDSASSLHQIRKCLLHPMQMQHHAHKPALDLIMKALEQHPSRNITLLKIKAHADHIGNEMADAGAKCAALMHDEHDLIFSADQEPGYSKDRYWLNIKKPVAHEGQEGTAQGQKRMRIRKVTNLQSSLADHMHQVHKLGKSNKDSCYYRYWQNIKPLVDPALSNAFFTSASYQVKRTVLGYRTGTLWNAKTAFRQKCALSPACPLCGLPDGGNHIAAGCKALSDMYTERHNRIGRIILRAAAKGSMGGNLISADVGSAEKCTTAGAPALCQNHAPLQLFPNTPFVASQLAKLRHLKPDIMMAIPCTGHQGSPLHPPTTKIIIAELKCCQDTRPQDQLARCLTQHNDLIELLKEAGYAEHNISVVPLLVGHSGSIYRMHTLDSLDRLGIEKSKAEKCARKIHNEATTSLDSIVKNRRRLEHQLPNQATHTVPKT